MEKVMSFEDLLEQKLREAIQPLAEEIKKLNAKFSVSDELGGVELAVLITGKKESTIYRYTSERKIPFRKIGGNLQFSRLELENWCKGKRKKTDAEIIST